MYFEISNLICTILYFGSAAASKYYHATYCSASLDFILYHYNVLCSVRYCITYSELVLLRLDCENREAGIVLIRLTDVPPGAKRRRISSVI